ncbi:MAG: hypothetical protein COU10_01285 [Candidatus Harrisonbacteria bacterium CG10_big_fil_rev_8_21_14_0_10_45_28]|uniref:ABC transporter ATP-binding protein n=1 Tax=Candidatus Harrisonbacteria bacterium CG10_big_fil_rev_8_21_14_0_10_45_28 TaxID=1974586 RepID=A0A2H0UNQ6_9BACT|nr:MAG: hypothetical protein COU10_01285 [Candidatus Harrisonbacteria bacterium CG10_big_fil_rev_8_21_14_0_10_45_28]
MEDQLKPQKGIQNPILYLFSKLWEYSRGNRRWVVVYFAMFLVGNIFFVLEPVAIGKVFNIIQQTGATQENLTKILILLGVFVFLRFAFWALHGPARVIENKNAFLVRANYKKYLLEGVMALPASWHTDHHSGDTIDRVEKGTTALADFAESSFIIIGQCMILLGSYIAMSLYNIHASYIILILVILNILIIRAYDKKLVPQWGKLNRAENRISEKIYDVISNITTVIILRIEKLLSKSIMMRIMHPFGLHIRNSKKNEMKWFLVSMVNVTGVFFVLGSYIFFSMQTGTVILAGTLFILFGYVDRVSNVFFEFAYYYGKLVRFKTKVQNAEELADEFEPKERSSQINLRKGWETLALQDFSFSYHSEDGANLHLDNISFEIHRGSKVALVGESGSGKTTILKVLRELYPPKSGQVLLDGQKLEKGLSSISSHISLIPQDPEIFKTTVLENITFGIPYPPELVEKYIAMANLKNVIERLPKGLSSSIVERGVNLSGGEKQRLALARGLLASKNKEIILLDEPTSSVDTANELEIFKNIFEDFKEKAIVASVHRLHLLPLFDQIYFFNKGKIVASGNFNELLQSSTEFASLWEKYQITLTVE